MKEQTKRKNIQVAWKKGKLLNKKETKIKIIVPSHVIPTYCDDAFFISTS